MLSFDLKRWTKAEIRRYGTPLAAAALLFLGLYRHGWLTAQHSAASDLDGGIKSSIAAPTDGWLAGPRTLDLGTIPDDHESEGEFQLRNALGNAVAIESVLTGCGCTVVQIKTPQALDPGQSVRLPVLFRPASGGAGPFEKRIVVQASSGQHRQRLVLRVRGRVEIAQTILAFPSPLDFGEVQGDRGNAVLYVRGPAPLVQALPDSIIIRGSAPVDIQLSALPASGELSHKVVRVSLAAGKLADGVLRSEIRIHYRAPDGRLTDVSVPVKASGEPVLSAPRAIPLQAAGTRN